MYRKSDPPPCSLEEIFVKSRGCPYPWEDEEVGLCFVTGCVCADMLVNMERKKKRKKNMNKNSFADTLFMFVASRGSTWVATVRVSTGFQPNKMLHSTWEGGRVGVGCACMSACGQGWKRPGRRFAWRLKRRTFTEESRGRKKRVGMERHYWISTTLLKGTHTHTQA